MRNLTPRELYENGIEAMKKKEYLKAEKYFLASLFELTKNPEAMSGRGDDSVVNLALYLYSKGKFENKDRALEFYKLFSRVDEIVSLGYAMALINGVFGDPDYNEAIKQLSKTYLNDLLYWLAYLLHNGKGLEKDSYKAALLLKSHGGLALKSNKFGQQANELFDSIGIKIEITDEELDEEADKIIYEEIFKDKSMELEESTSLESLVIEFFKNKNNIPDTTDIEMETDENKEPAHTGPLTTIEENNIIYKLKKKFNFEVKSVNARRFVVGVPYIYKTTTGETIKLYKCKLFNEKCEEIPLENEYNSIYSFAQSVATVEIRKNIKIKNGKVVGYDKKQGLIDVNGKELLPCIYDYINVHLDGFTEIIKDGVKKVTWVSKIKNGEFNWDEAFRR